MLNLVKNHSKSFWGTKAYNRLANDKNSRKEMKMAEKIAEKMPKEKIEELKQMLKEKKPDDPVEKVLVDFCEHHAVSLGTCRQYYERLVEKGDVK